MKTIPLAYSFAKNNGVIASLDPSNHSLIVYHIHKPTLATLGELTRLLSEPFRLIEVSEAEFQQQLAKTYQSEGSITDMAENMSSVIDLSLLANQLSTASEDLLANHDDAPVIRLINALFTQAIKQKASDIHIETYEDKVLVRNRVDGVLHEILEIQRAISPLVISRVKVMAKLDIAEKRIPQDGRITLRVGGHTIDVRVSTLPSNHGERIVLRILDKEAANLNLSLLGMPPHALNTIKNMIAAPHGIILVTGPTGSGKTTSLYAMLTDLNEVHRNILTIEDPIEYDLPGVGQIQVNTKVNMTFAKGLRAILRQDPDVVMIGEIRDIETAEIAVQASLTGHLVLSTLHTNSALGALTRLRDMGVESFLLSSSLIGLIAQRLVRRLCSYCKKPQVLDKEEIALLGFSDTIDLSKVCEPQGCEHCNYLGYRGRTGIYELIIIDETLRSMIHRNEALQVIEDYIRPNIPSIREDGFKRVLAGDTSLSEILRVTSQY